MAKYQNGKIYKITNSETKEIYIGSTCQSLNCRMNNHRADFKRGGTTSSIEILKYQYPLIVLIEDYPCNSKYELLKREAFYILNNDCVNKQIPARSDDEKKEYDKKWYETNKEEIKAKNMAYYEANKAKKMTYYEANKEEIKAKKMAYYEANKEKVNAKSNEYRDANKEAINEKKRLKRQEAKSNLI